MSERLVDKHNFGGLRDNLEELKLSSSDASEPVFSLTNTDTTKADSAELKFVKDAADVEDDEQLGHVSFYGDDGEATAVQMEYGSIKGTVSSKTSGAERGKLSFSTACAAGVNAECLSVTGGATAASSTVSVPGNLAVTGTISGVLVPTTVVTSATYSGTYSATTYKGLITQATWPANCYLTSIDVAVTVGAIASDTATDDTIINVADGTVGIVGTATTVNTNGTTKPGGTGKVLFAANTNRVLGSVGTIAAADLVAADASRVSTSARTFTATIFHDANGTNDGNGDGADAITHNSAKVYVIYKGFRIN